MNDSLLDKIIYIQNTVKCQGWPDTYHGLVGVFPWVT